MGKDITWKRHIWDLYGIYMGFIWDLLGYLKIYIYVCMLYVCYMYIYMYICHTFFFGC